ncbi:haloacid dehalogenase-like hydrolase [Aestuariicella hydrocarbonica]|uniref:Haloacid dehalogenase-like hydrolase n=1 Tax=Pseudomaricurvus hydrocarbonicus TaxID=1470433 RepID=A0A9E5JVC3_9GAMM|nr:HAD family hydrolase [Aestuariicella hydrocarbonica]NHO66268.1 haloacid dehalogenase-like hydrolase [Aestuariicella hydrocarbonica]
MPLRQLPLRQFALLLIFGLCAALASAQSNRQDPLPSWNEGTVKSTIIKFVQQVSTEGSPYFVPAAERIATFDNDGTLWAEQPLYFQAIFAIDQVNEKAADHPQWRQEEPFKSAITGDIAGIMATGMEGLGKIIAASHANLTADEFRTSVRHWLASARHPQTDTLFTDLIYQPMLELLQYLRAHDFKTFIVSGGGIDFIRVFSEDTYGIPPEQVIGTTSEAKYEVINGIPTIVKTPNIILVDDKDGKPVGIYRHIGRRPIFAAGNSDGDKQMLEYTTLPHGSDDQTPRLGLIIHHTDAKREWAYDRQSDIGKLDKALDESRQHNWAVVNMKKDWRQVFPKAR